MLRDQQPEPEQRKPESIVHGCHNRKPFKKFLKVQDGWHDSGIRRMKTIPFRMAEQCMYDLKTTDEGCRECKWI
jgi:hypothetical protein